MKRRKRCDSCGNLFSPYKTTQKVCSYVCALEFNVRKKKKEKALIDGLIKVRWRCIVFGCVCILSCKCTRNSEP